VFGKEKMALDVFTFHATNKYHGRFDEKMAAGYTVHNAILVCPKIPQPIIVYILTLLQLDQRRFTLDNSVLFQKAAPVNDEDEQSDSEPPITGAKRARTHGGKIAKGADFWGMVDKFFVDKIAELNGRDLAGAEWRECVF
jgi:hypothetical protein